MRRIALIAAALVIIAGCSKISSITPVSVFSPNDYQWHKVTPQAKLHWSYIKNGTTNITAEGYIEPFNPKYGLTAVRLELVGLDADGAVVNSAEGRPDESMIMPPSDASFFRITMELNGKETDFTMRGDYHYFLVGTQPTITSDNHGEIPLVADEPY